MWCVVEYARRNDDGVPMLLRVLGPFPNRWAADQACSQHDRDSFRLSFPLVMGDGEAATATAA